MRPWRCRLCLGLLTASFVGLLLQYDLDQHPLGLYLCLGVGLAALVLFSTSRVDLGAGAILAAAGLFRLLLVPLPATLSDDVHRYLWDGKVTIAGFNPYAHAPDAGELEALRDDLWERLAHREVETVYPPLALTLFSIAALLPRPIYGYKLLLIFADLVGCVLLLLLARRRGVAPSRTVWYAWHPLVVLEGAGMGHIDVVGVSLVIGTLLCLSPGGPRGTSPRPVSAAALLAALGVLTKLVPIVCWPMWALQSGRPRRFLSVALLVTLLAVAPILLALGGPPPGLVTYAVSWEFNGPLYEPLWRLLDAVPAVDLIKSGLDRAKGLTGWHDFWNRFYPVVYPQFLAKAILGVALVGIVLRSLRWRDPVVGSRRMLGAALLTSATLYPWYLLWVLPVAALSRGRPWLVLSASLPLAYLPALTPIAYFPWTYLLIWLPFLVSLGVERRWSTG